MSEPLGSFCLVLHGHLPYVLCHGEWPHGEDWLYEAAAETYLPILAMVDECIYLNAKPSITVGLTPVLLEQLCHARFKDGFEKYLKLHVERAEADRKEFESHDQKHMAHLADCWAKWYGNRLEQFQRINRDIPTAYADHAKAGNIEILTSNATHGYMPLLLEDNSIRAQMRAGMASSHRILGFRPSGMWLPECAYRPGGEWNPAIAWGGTRLRTGVEHLVGAEGVTHFFVENHLVEGANSEYVNNDGWQRVGWEESEKYASRGWRDVREPNWVNSDGTSPGTVAAFARDNVICEQVWSGAFGYPASGEYLEFHKKHGHRRGLRYWKVTGKGVDLGEKDLYYPDDIDGKIHQDVAHFCNSIKDRLRDYRQKTGRHGAVTASFDAELFGHWWFEGPRFLRDVILTLNADPEVEVSTTQQYVQNHPPDKSVSLPEGSWGEEGDHRVWMNDNTKWIWEIEYRCEALFGKLTYELPWDDPKHPQQAATKAMLEKAGRELLLMQASDWPFVITRGQAIDYGIKRFVLHAGRFENLCAIAERIARGEELNELEKFEIQDSEVHDVIFPEMDLHWWDG